MAIHPYFAVAVYAIKFNKYIFILCSGRQRKCFAVPANTCWQGSLVGRARIFFTEFALNAPVVWQVECSPVVIIITGLFGNSGIAQKEFPVVVKVDDGAGRNLLGSCCT